LLLPTAASFTIESFGESALLPEGGSLRRPTDGPAGLQATAIRARTPFAAISGKWTHGRCGRHGRSGLRASIVFPIGCSVHPVHFVHAVHPIPTLHIPCPFGHSVRRPGRRAIIRTPRVVFGPTGADSAVSEILIVDRNSSRLARATLVS